LAEDEKDISSSKNRVSKDELMSLMANIVDVEVEGMTFGIRPISWKEDLDLDRSASASRDENGRLFGEEEQARERMKQMVWLGVVDPKMSQVEVDKLPVGLVIRLAREIGKISSYIEKNE
jgi:hypothetical protein